MSCVARESRFTSVCLCTQVVVMITLIALLFLAMIAYMIYARDQVQVRPTPFLAVLNCQIIPPISPSLTRLSSLLWRGLVLLPPAHPWSTVLYS